MNELKAYQHRRLDLADMIRATLHIARGYADAQREQEARQLLERLVSGRFQLAVAGQFSRGKTTLLNALLGEAYLPMGAQPMTSVVTTVRYGSRPRATVRRRGSPLPVEAPLTDVARFVAQASAERAELQVTSVEVEVPAEILRLGFEFADTPGIGSAIEVNTATTARFLPQADAVIAVTGFDSPLTQAETDFLTLVGEHAGKLFVVINKRDLISGRDAAEVTGYVQRWLRDHLPLGRPQVFGLSALEALEAGIQGDHERMAASGVLALRGALADFLTTAKARTYLHNVATRATDLAAGQGRDLRLGCLAADGASGPDAVAPAFDTRMEELSAAEHASSGPVPARRAPRWPGARPARLPSQLRRAPPPHALITPYRATGDGETQVCPPAPPLVLSPGRLAGRSPVGSAYCGVAVRVTSICVAEGHSRALNALSAGGSRRGRERLRPVPPTHADPWLAVICLTRDNDGGDEARRNRVTAADGLYRGYQAWAGQRRCSWRVCSS